MSENTAPALPQGSVDRDTYVTNLTRQYLELGFTPEHAALIAENATIVADEVQSALSEITDRLVNPIAELHPDIVPFAVLRQATTLIIARLEVASQQLEEQFALTLEPPTGSAH